MSFIDAHDFPAGLVLRVLGVPAATYYDWRARRVSPSRRQLDDAALLEQILEDPRRARVRRHFPGGRPARQRATYTPTAGVRHMFGALDLASGQMVRPVPRS